MKRALLFTVVLTAFAVDAYAVDPRRAKDWTERLEKTSTLLKQQSYGQALPILRKLIGEMMETLGPGDETTYAMVVPLIQIAIAEVGSGDRAAGLWHWQMAQTLYPKSAESDLSAFGEPGAFLKANILSPARAERCLVPKADTPPRPIRHVAPRYPAGARRFGEAGTLIVALKVRADGTPADPRIVQALPTPLSYAALEALRRWKFTPAKSNGAAVESDYCLTIGFNLR